MAYLNEYGRPEPPIAGDDTDTFLGSLERQRATLAWKCGGVDAAGIRAMIGASSLTLGGLLKHMANNEDNTLGVMFLGNDPSPPWDTADWDAVPDWDHRVTDDDTPEGLMRLWEDAVDRSRAVVAEALERGDMDQPAAFTTSSGAVPNLRRLMIDLIEEYARHLGQADLLREAVDGLVGEDPP